MKKKPADTLATSVAKKVGTALGTLAATTKNFIDHPGLPQSEKAKPSPKRTRTRSAKKASKKSTAPKKATKVASRKKKTIAAKKRATRKK